MRASILPPPSADLLRGFIELRVGQRRTVARRCISHLYRRKWKTADATHTAVHDVAKQAIATHEAFTPTAYKLFPRAAMSGWPSRAISISATRRNSECNSSAIDHVCPSIRVSAACG